MVHTYQKGKAAGVLEVGVSSTVVLELQKSGHSLFVYSNLVKWYKLYM